MHLLLAFTQWQEAVVRHLTIKSSLSEITGLKWNRIDLERQTAWLNQTKNGTPRGVPVM